MLPTFVKEHMDIYVQDTALLDSYNQLSTVVSDFADVINIKAVWAFYISFECLCSYNNISKQILCSKYLVLPRKFLNSKI